MDFKSRTEESIDKHESIDGAVTKLHESVLFEPDTDDLDTSP